MQPFLSEGSANEADSRPHSSNPGPSISNPGNLHIQTTSLPNQALSSLDLSNQLDVTTAFSTDPPFGPPVSLGFSAAPPPPKRLRRCNAMYGAE